MIKSLSVKGLNNRVDADLEFNEDLNIITGKNGSGKTTVLKLLWYLISGNLERIIREIPFRSVSIETNSFSLLINQIDSDKGRLECRFPYTKKVVVNFETPLREYGEQIHELNVRIARVMKSSLFFPTFRRIEGGFHEGSLISFTETGMPQLQTALSELSDALSVYNHKFVASVSTSDIGELLTQKYADINNEISERQSRLLLEISEKLQLSLSGDINSEVSKAMPSVLTDIQRLDDERDQLFRPFVALSELTQSILDYQAIRVGGLSDLGEVTDGITLGEEIGDAALGTIEEAIASDKLSSGEKQMLSFLCYNAFSENTPIFIDEPELSLHVDWQRLLLPTLLEQGTDNQFFIATHSPFIYFKYPDKEILLGDDRGDN